MTAAGAKITAAAIAKPSVIAQTVAGATLATATVDLITPWSLLTATAGLVAFHIGLFTLVGRERKSPYVINLVFGIFLLCLLSATAALAAALIPLYSAQILFAGTVVLVLAFAVSLWAVYRIAARFIYFVDVVHPRHFPIIRHVRRWFSTRKPRTYEHDTIPVSADIIADIRNAITPLATTDRAPGNQRTRSLAVRLKKQEDGWSLLVKLCQAFLSRGYSIQYLAASRHPLEFIEHLKESFQNTDWPEAAKRIVAIDGYSPHFAFLNSIYQKKDRLLESYGVDRISSTMTYAGLHSASSRAFKRIRKKMGADFRKPTLVVYDGCYALTDLESKEQYRVFLRHVIPSEKMWDGMFTVFVETAIAADDWELLTAYADIEVDLTKKRNGPQATTGTEQ